MSFSDAITQVDQILRWQQQLAEPAERLATSTATVGADGGSVANVSTGSVTDSGPASDSAFADALEQAQVSTEAGTAGAGSGVSASADLLGSGDSQLMQLLASINSSATNTAADGTTGGLPVGVDTAKSAGSAADPRVEAMRTEADSLVGKPYIWGGGHDGWGSQAGYDCSGFVSAVLHAGGYLSSPQDTATLPTAAGIEKGAGQYVTIYDRDKAGVQGHVIIDIGGQFYESGGQAGSWGGGGGVEKISTPSAAYLASFNDVLHPAGL